jgi:hypothetical protein
LFYSSQHLRHVALSEYSKRRGPLSIDLIHCDENLAMDRGYIVRR